MDYFREKKAKFISIAHKIKGFVRKAFGTSGITLAESVESEILDYSISGNSVQDGTPAPFTPVEVESVGDLVENKFDVSLYTMKENYNVDTRYSFYKAAYIDGLKPNTDYYVVIERFNDTKPNTVKTTLVISGEDFYVGAGKYTAIAQSNSSVEVNGSPHNSGTNGRLTIGIATSTTQEQLDAIWLNTNVCLLEAKEDINHLWEYKIPVKINGTTNNIYLKEPLRKYGNYADVIDFKNKQVIRNIYENDFRDINTSSLYNFTIFKPSSELVAFRIAYKGAKLKYAMASINVKGNAYCNMYPIVSSSKRAEYTLSGGATNNATFDFIDSDYTTQEAWIAHINELTANGTPLKVIHTLKTPYEEPIELPELKAYQDITDITIDTTVAPSATMFEYYSYRKEDTNV